ncbi:MAG: IS4 family transposase [Magnetococcales bacterium]|nr:IS4 family transposase [Magnetococcales bacterium]
MNYESHRGRKRGFGMVGDGRNIGFFLHPVIAVDANDGGILGLCGAEIWQRTNKADPAYKKLPIEKKESYRWIKGAKAAKDALKSAATVTVIADRESDIYEEWDRIPDERTHMLTRAMGDRAVCGGGTLFSFSDSLPVACLQEFILPPGHGRVGRTVHLEVRYGAVEIKRPRQCSDPSASKSIVLRLVDAREVNAPDGVDPIHWRILTTHSVSSGEDALWIVGLYRHRWLIEQLFRTLKKQGFNIESSQIEDSDPLEKLAVIALICAVRTLQLTMARGGGTERPASDVFGESEIEFIEVLQPELEGKTIKQKNCFPTGSLAWAVWIIARLGGWKGYASESPPGPITMLRGLIKFELLLEGWKLASKKMCA